MRKAQMEIMGLALIVILISIAMLFVIKFTVFSEPPEQKQEFTKTELASNFINTLLKTTNPSCRDLTFTELFQDVARGWSSNIFTYCPGHGNTKDVLNNNLTKILTESLEKWNIHYEFDATITGNTPINIFIAQNAGCPGEKTPKTFPIPIDASGSRVLDITLSICS